MTGLKPNKALFPLAAAFRAGVAVRNGLYDLGILREYHSSLPVVCVGNITVGGSGKTPFVQFLAEKFKRLGFSPVILSRGYLGKVQGPYQVQAADNAELVGDEALSHFEKLRGIAQVVVAKERRAGAKFIEREKIGDLIILDDGYQHRALGRDCNILLLDISTEETREKWSPGSLLPAGWLRETFRTGVKRATCIVLVSKGRAKLPLPSIPTEKPTFLFQFLPRTIKDVQAKVILPTEVLKGKNIIAATGIGEPTQFFALLRSLGAKIDDERVFPNHYHFEKADLDALGPTEAHPLFVTSKDAVKLKNFLSHPGRVYSLELGGGFYDLTQEQEFLRLCLQAIETKRGT